MSRFLVSAMAVLLSGCATNQLAFTYYSDPPGAVLYDYSAGKRLGDTPITIYYEISKDQFEEGRARISGTSVKWISGATASVEYIDADLNRDGYKQTFTFRRPDNAPGLELDERFVIEQQQQQDEYLHQKCLGGARSQFEVENCNIDKGVHGFLKSNTERNK